MTLSVLMPVFNERATIDAIIARVLEQPLVSQCIIVDDGSTDGTRHRIERCLSGDKRLELLVHATNRGKGAAVRTALTRASSPVCIVQDADLEYDPVDYEAVVRPILDGRCNVVFGSRVLHPANRYPLDRFRVGSFIVTQTANLLYCAQLTDEPTGYKAFDTALLKSLPLRADGFAFCPEVTAWVRKRGEAITEVPIRYRKRSVKEGKKIRWRDGAEALWTLARIRFE